MTARTQKETALATLVEYLEAIEAQITSLKADHAAVSRAIDVLNSTSEHFASPAAQALRRAGSNWRSLKGQQAVLKLLRENDTKWLKASQITRALKARGVRGTKNFSVVIDGTVRRLAGKGVLAHKRNENGILVFQIKKKEEPGAADTAPDSE